jgi:hypothetical protein
MRIAVANHTGATPPLAIPDDPTASRLEDQISWYDKKSRHSQYWYKGLKTAEIVAAAILAGLAGFGVPRLYLVSLAVLVVALEGLQQLNQWHANWISYRSTCEALKHEKYLYLAAAGGYEEEDGRHALLAERIESLVSQEHAKWASTHEQEPKPGGKHH